MLEESRKNQNDVEIAVLAKEVEHMGDNLNSFKESMSERLQSLTEVIKSFVEIANKKVDRDLYLEDRREMAKQLELMESEIKKNTDFRKELTASQQGKSEGVKTVLGLSQGAISSVISLLTIVTLIAAVAALFQ